MEKSVAKIKGYLKAVADHQHPLQTKLSLILTDFEPNGNLQGIPVKEKTNILTSALYMPLKINFDGDDIAGHTGAYPVGPIVHVYEGIDNGRDVIYGDAIIWNELHNDVAGHVKAAFAEGIGTSWEIYYDTAEKDDNGVSWLHGCVFAGTCIVETPAYGPSRTRILAVAEALRDNNLQHIGEVENMAKTETSSVDVANADLEETRTDIIDAQDLLWKLWAGLDALYSTTFEIESQQTEANIGTVANDFAGILGKIETRMNELKSEVSAKSEALQSAQAALETVQTELTSIKEVAKVEAESRAKAERLSTRRTVLQEAGIEISADAWASRETFYDSMSEDVFTNYVADLQAIASKTNAKAELKTPKVPEPLSSDTGMSSQELAAALKEAFKK